MRLIYHVLAASLLSGLSLSAQARPAYPVLSPRAWVGYSGPADAFPGYVAGSRFSQVGVFGHEWDLLSPKKPWSIGVPADDTVRLELRQGDQCSFDLQARTGSERNEFAAAYDGKNQTPPGPGRIPLDASVHVRYGLTVETGRTNSAPWFVLTQLHEDEVGGSPPVSINLAPRSDAMMVNIGYTTPSGKNINHPIWTDDAPLSRGRRYEIEQWMRINAQGRGRVIVYRDGVKLVDYTGRIGYVGQTNSFWKFGPYRHGPTPETIAVRYDQVVFDWTVGPWMEPRRQP